MSRSVNPRPQFFDSAGDPLISGKMYYFESATDVPKVTYADVNQTIPNTHPVVLTGDGRLPNVFFDGAARQKLTDANDVQLWDVDPVGADDVDVNFSQWNPLIIYNDTNIVQGSDNNFYQSFSNGNINNDPLTSPTEWQEIEFINVWNTNVIYAVGDTVKASDNLLYSSLTALNQGNDPVGDIVNWGTPFAFSVVDDTTPQLGGNLDANGHQIQWSKGADVASAAALPVLTDGNYFDVTGIVAITSIDTTGGPGTVIKLHFDDALVLTHDGVNIILPGAANITTTAGDEAEFVEFAAGQYRCTNYLQAAVPTFETALETKTAAYSALPADRGKTILADATAGAFAVTLPAEADAKNGYRLTIESINSTNPVTIEDDVGTDLILLEVAGDSVTVRCDGTAWYLVHVSKKPTVQLFSASDTYTPSVGMTKCFVQLIGGGAGGGGADGQGVGTSAGGGGGGGGAYNENWFSAADIGASQIVTIGANGTGGAGATGADGTDGTATSLGALLTGPGGTATNNGGGLGDAALLMVRGGTGGAAGTGGRFNKQGGNGGTSLKSPIALVSGYGGPGWGGDGSVGVYVNGTNVSGLNAPTRGGGGSGGATADVAGNASGGNGAGGYMIATEYY